MYDNKTNALNYILDSSTPTLWVRVNVIIASLPSTQLQNERQNFARVIVCSQMLLTPLRHLSTGGKKEKKSSLAPAKLSILFKTKESGLWALAFQHGLFLLYLSSLSAMHLARPIPTRCLLLASVYVFGQWLHLQPICWVSYHEDSDVERLFLKGMLSFPIWGTISTFLYNNTRHVA